MRYEGAAVRRLALLCALTVLGGCGDNDGVTVPSGLAAAQPANYTARGSVGQVAVTDAEPGTALELLDAAERVVATGTTDGEGTLLFRALPPGAGYVVVSRDDTGLRASDRVAVTTASEVPDPSFYAQQRLGAGYGYIQTRDGTLLAVNVILPGPIEDGPYPTVVEYSGYDPANPDQPQPSSLIASALGFAAVGVNMRGTGCSGGAFSYFETLQSTDGYDAVEIVAAQPWVKGGKVGMVGISYPGISQLFVARLQPPHLAAIAPLSVVADPGRGTLYPGGILNDGFAIDWARGRMSDAAPGGQPWARKRMNAGDLTCIANQRMRGQNEDLIAMIGRNVHYDPTVADPLSPVTFVDRIAVPVFLAGAWQDEQTGGHFATMLDRFTGTDRAFFTLVNGTHADPLGPAIFSRWFEFLSFYVARQIPRQPAAGSLVLQVLAREAFGVSRLHIERDRFTNGLTFEEARARFEAEPRVRILFENGALEPLGGPAPGFEEGFATWPVNGVEPAAWYFDAAGKLATEPPVTSAGADRYYYDTADAQRTTFNGSSDAVWRALAPLDWRPLPADKSVAYATEPLAADLVMVGSGSVDLWIKSTLSDVDLQVTLSEIRPDGREMYVQNGWLRASHRALDEAASSLLRPVRTDRAADARPLPTGEFVLARVEIFPFAHAFRAGSRIRVSVEAPGGSRPLWKFAALPGDGTATVAVARSAAHPSRVVLPVVPDATIPTALPPCPSLRGQPCREYVEGENAEGE
ncbi:CocE/NonD family hydrolase [Candidatus Binatia bacterium]|nr:CocE/NonD family hydrolase [Candidatus Binatia bacterium]